MMNRSAFNVLKNAGKYLILSRSIPEELRVSQVTPELCRKNAGVYAVAIIAMANAEVCGTSAPWMRNLRETLRNV